MSSRRDYYKVLGVRRDADQAAIKAAFKREARKHHPDLHKGSPEKEAAFREINEAYSTLSSPEKRAAYDNDFNIPGNGGRASGPDFQRTSRVTLDDVFERLFLDPANPFSTTQSRRFASITEENLETISKRGDIGLLLEISLSANPAHRLRESAGKKAVELVNDADSIVRILDFGKQDFLRPQSLPREVIKVAEGKLAALIMSNTFNLNFLISVTKHGGFGEELRLTAGLRAVAQTDDADDLMKIRKREESLLDIRSPPREVVCAVDNKLIDRIRQPHRKYNTAWLIQVALSSEFDSTLREVAGLRAIEQATDADELVKLALSSRHVPSVIEEAAKTKLIIMIKDPSLRFNPGWLREVASNYSAGKELRIAAGMKLLDQVSGNSQKTTSDKDNIRLNELLKIAKNVHVPDEVRDEAGSRALNLVVQYKGKKLLAELSEDYSLTSDTRKGARSALKSL